jgi:hypothetical protein
MVPSVWDRLVAPSFILVIVPESYMFGISYNFR